MKKLTTLIAMAAIAGSASAALVIPSANTEVLVDFETDIATVFVANVGDYQWSRTVTEPDHSETAGDNRGPIVLSTSWATTHIWHGDGTPDSFLADANGNGVTNDVLGSNQMGMYDGAGAAGNHAYRLTLEQQWAGTSLYLRIQNTTGAAVTEWNFDTDVYFGEADVGDSTTLQYSYAVGNDTDAGTMTFTNFGSTLSSVTGDVITSLAGTMSESVTTASVADGDYIVLQIYSVTASGSGSTSFVDNIGVTAIPEPATLSLIAALSGAMLFIRRRLMM